MSTDHPAGEAARADTAPTAAPARAVDALCPACGATCANAAAADARCPTCGAPPRLQDRYLLRRVLGANVGTTYLADDLRRGEAVVVKELVFARLDAWKTEELFRREAEVLRQLEHPRIPRCLDAFSEGQGKQLRSYLVQQHLDGQDLRAELTQRRYTDQDVLDILDEVLELLEYLQRLRPPLIHRDLKPSNLMRLRDGHIALIDFGSVRDLLAEAGSNATVAGTFGFMAPEQFRGEAFLQTDLYGLGAVAVQLLCRVSPDKMLVSGTELVWQSHVSAAPPLKRFLERLLAPDPADRPANAAEARALLARTRADLARGTVDAKVPARHTTERGAAARRGNERGATSEADAADERGAPPVRRARVPLLVGAAAALVAGGAVFLLTQRGEQSATVVVRPAPAPLRGADSRQPAQAALSSNTTNPADLAKAAQPSFELKPLSRDLPEAELVALLTAQPWEGRVGRITFRKTARGLGASWQVRGGAALAFDLVALGPLATLTLKVERDVAGVLNSDVFHGALSADRRTLFGSHEKRYREGTQLHEEQGPWSVSVAPPAASR